LERLLDAVTGEHLVEDVVGKMSPVAAIKEDLD
jgi:hypothetical protein